MEPTQLMLAQLVTFAGLLGATIEYCELMRRRAQRRAADAERLAAQASGLQGLVRIFLAEPVEGRRQR
jgi:hypothetical protein